MQLYCRHANQQRHFLLGTENLKRVISGVARTKKIVPDHVPQLEKKTKKHALNIHISVSKCLLTCIGNKSGQAKRAVSRVSVK